MNPSFIEGNLRMMPNNLKVEMQVKEVIPHTNDTCHKHTRYEIMHGECCHKNRYGARNGKRASNRNQDEVHIAVMNSARGPLEYVPS